MSTEDLDRLEHREKQVLWVCGYYKEEGTRPGSFYELLIKAFFAADRENYLRLEMGFPITAMAHRNYMSGALKEKYDLKD